MIRCLIIFIIAVSASGCMKNPKTLNFGFKGSQKKQQKQIDQDQDDDRKAFMDPASLTEQAPDRFKVRMATTQGDIILKVNRDWSPNGADRFYNMVKSGYFNDIAIFRAIKGFIFQFGVHGDPEVSAQWARANIKDDPILDGVGNEAGYITFAHSGTVDSRSVQLFINLADNRAKLDHLRFTPFGQVVEGMDVVEKINTEYGENRNGEQRKLKMNGNDYIREVMPNADFIESITFVDEDE